MSICASRLLFKEDYYLEIEAPTNDLGLFFGGKWRLDLCSRLSDQGGPGQSTVTHVLTKTVVLPYYLYWCCGSKYIEFWIRIHRPAEFNYLWAKTASAARILPPKHTRRPSPCLLNQSFFYDGWVRQFAFVSVFMIILCLERKNLKFRTDANQCTFEWLPMMLPLSYKTLLKKL